MIVQYTAAAIVNDLASRAMPASLYSIPTSANAEDHVSMGANEARHVLAMTQDLGKVLGLELFTAAQALDPVSYTHLDVYKRQMLIRKSVRFAPAGVMKIWPATTPNRNYRVWVFRLG